VEGTQVSTTPELGFEYFPSPENDDDSERIAYLILYLSEAVRKWPRFRRRFIRAGLGTPQQCDHIEAHVISIFRETLNVMLAAIDNGDLEAMAEQRLLDRLLNAHAVLALFATPQNMAGYRDMVFARRPGDGSARLPEIGDFNRSLWEAAWDTRDGPMPAQVTKALARRHRLTRKRDGLYNSHGSLDIVANASAYEEGATEGPAVLSSDQSERLERELESLISELRKVARRAGLKRAQVDFLVEMAVDKRQQKDNPSAWKAIRERKRHTLYPEIRKLTESIRQFRKDILS
jgi:hypothetical protein